jgi:hypothetical protein
MSEPVDVRVPFRWDLMTPDQLGSLLADTADPNLWFLDDLIACAGKVLARSGNGDLIFVGRSLDSMFDLLSGALAHLAIDTQLARLPFSFQRQPIQLGPPRRWRVPPLTPTQRFAARQVLSDVGISPADLARRTRPVTFVDVVSEGWTFTELFDLLDAWITETRQPWGVFRRKLRFVGVTIRRKTSPNTWRWQQHAPWTRRLPSGAVVNVSLDGYVWSYLGNHQIKLTRSYRPDQWTATADGPGRDEKTRQALAEAVAVMSYGRTTAGRRAIARAIDGEPALAQPWLRSLVRQFNSGA